MIFKDCKMRDKKKTKREITEKIMESLTKKLDTEEVPFNNNLVEIYVSDLIDYTEYEPINGVFYCSNPTVTFREDLLVDVAFDYISEHNKEYII